MKRFENNLKLIQSSLNPSTRSVLSSELSLSDDEIYFLKAKCLIETRRDYDNAYRITLTDTGITYFADKKEALFKTLLSWTVNFSVAVLSAICGSGFTLLIQFLIQ